MKKLISALLALILVLTMVPAAAFGATVQRGTCGADADWTLDTDGTLTISGSGAMDDYTDTAAPWSGSAVRYVVVEEGVTALGAGAFRDLSDLQAVQLSAAMTTIPAAAFDGCAALELVVIPNDLTTVADNAFRGCGALAALYYRGSAAELEEMVAGLSVGAGNEAFTAAQLALVVLPTAHPTDAATSVGGRSVTFTAAASHESARYQWMMQTPDSSQWKMVADLAGCRTDTLTVPGEKQYDGCRFACYLYVDEAGYGVREAMTDSATMTVYDAPVILEEPRTVRVSEGEVATVSLRAAGEGLTYQWYFASYGKEEFQPTDSFTGPEYTVEMTESRAGRRVYCVVTDRYGVSVTSQTAMLVMRSNLAITQQPQSVLIGDGVEGTVSLKAQGVGLKYQWYYAAAGSDLFSLTDTFTGPDYTITMNDSRNGRQIYCRVSDRYGNSVESDVATLTMAPRPQITVQPTNAYVNEGEMATVTVAAEGEELQYAWYWAAKGSADFKLTETFTGPEYSVEMTESRDGRRVYCLITDKYGVKLRTDVATLRIATPLVIHSQPQSVTAAEGEMATVTVEAQGDGLRYEWYWAAPGSNTFKKTDTFTSNTYSVEMADERDGRRVYCRVIDRYGASVDSDIATLTMGAVALAITQQPQSVTVDEGEKATVTVKAVGTGLKYAWYYSEDDGKTFAKTDAFTGDTYAVTMNESRDGRQLYCVVSDREGNSVRSEVVTIAMTRAAALTITQQPQSVTVDEGEKATVTVKAEGEGLKYAWYFSEDDGQTFAKTDSFTGDTYAVTMNESRNGRQLYCVVSDQYGNSVKSEVVTIAMASRKLTITSQPAGYVTAGKGEMAVVTVEAVGEGALTYQWYWAKAGSSEFKLTTSFTGAEYSVEMADSRAGRKVYCVITDESGESVRSEVITLRMALRLTRDAADDAALAGKKVSVSVAAEGEGLQYAWYFCDRGSDDFALTGSFKTNTYALTMNEARDGRRIYCVVSDRYGNEVTSAVATISMAQPPVITVPPTYAYAKKGEMATIRFEAEGQGELTYTWYWAAAGSSTYKKTATFTGPEYSVEMTDSRAGRKVYCIVTDENGLTTRTKTCTVRMALEITDDIESVTVAKGKKASVTVKANGQDLSYKWYYSDDGGETFHLTGSFKTATYALTMTAARAERQIYCVVTDKYGNTATSAVATLHMK